MNKEEALLYLGASNDYDSAYQEALFDLKKDLIQKPPFTKVYRIKKAKLLQLNEAFETLGGELDRSEIDVETPVLVGSVEEVFNRFYYQRNMLFHRINMSQNGNEIIQLMDAYVALYRLYAKCWELPLEVKSDIIISKEPDPMDLLSSIKSQNSGTTLTFEDIMAGNAQGIVFEEAQRLTLWTKFEEDHGKLR